MLGALLALMKALPESLLECSTKQFTVWEEMASPCASALPYPPLSPTPVGSLLGFKEPHGRLLSGEMVVGSRAW